MNIFKNRNHTVGLTE